MECRDTERLIDTYLDRELPAEASCKLESHLAECAGCRSAYGHLIALLRSPEAVDFPAGLRDRIVGAVNERIGDSPFASPASGGPTQRARSSWARLVLTPWSGAVAASLMFFVMGWFSSLLWTQTHRPSPDVVATPPEQVTVVVSPWLMNAWAQSFALRGPANPLAFVVSAASADMLVEREYEEIPVIRVFQRPRKIEEPAEGPEPLPPGLPLLPLGPRLIGV